MTGAREPAVALDSERWHSRLPISINTFPLPPIVSGVPRVERSSFRERTLEERLGGKPVDDVEDTSANIRRED
jgi:hypothetical protein